jgi:signal transduction histidine kinase
VLGVSALVSSHITIVSNIQDISEQIEAKNRLLNLNQSLEKRVQDAIELTKRQDEKIQEQTRLAQMGEMISMIAHQWRQPLGAINTAIMSINTKRKLGKFDLNKEEDRDKFFAFMDKKHTNVLNYVQGLSQTIDDFRNFFKPNKAKELVSITQPIENALDIVEASMESKGIIIEKRYEDISEISLYQNELMQVVLNILKNAQDNFIEKSIKDAKIEISTRVEGDEHIITIRDNGGGIPDDILPKIFDPYFSTKDERNGTGLGLYMSKTIVEEHHNGILSAVNSEDNIIFEIKLKGESYV